MSITDYSYTKRTQEMEQARKQRAREVAIEAASRITSGGLSPATVANVIAQADIIARYITTGTVYR